MGFKLKKAHFESKELDLCLGNVDTSKNNFTVLIGKNGIGKSRLLSLIAKTFRGFDLKRLHYPPLFLFDRKQLHEFSMIYQINGREFTLGLHKNQTVANDYGREILPSKVICTSSSPFDKFPPERKSNDSRSPLLSYYLSTQKVYRYLGSKNNMGQFSSKAGIKRFLESMIIASQKEYVDLTNLLQVFTFLGYLPRIKADYRMSAPESVIESLAHGESLEKINDIIWRQNEKSIYRDNISKGILADESLAYELKSSAAHFISIYGGSKRRLSLELSFDNGDFSSSIIHSFRAATLLEKVGILRLENVYLSKSDEDNKWLKINEASSGEQCIVLTLLGIAGEIQDNSLICIDEPELSLHPEWQENFIKLLSQTFFNFKGCHFILATHSPQILSQLNEEDSYVVLMDESRTVAGAEYAKRSADFQLVEAFNTPGYKNEYLAREALLVYSNLKPGGELDQEFQDKYEMLEKVFPQLEKDDPVKKLISAIIEFKTSSTHD